MEYYALEGKKDNKAKAIQSIAENDVKYLQPVNKYTHKERVMLTRLALESECIITFLYAHPFVNLEEEADK